MVTAIAVLVAVVVAAAITWPCAIGYRKKVVETKLALRTPVSPSAARKPVSPLSVPLPKP